MTMWERMIDVPTKDSLFASVALLMDKAEELNTQLEAIGRSRVLLWMLQRQRQRGWWSMGAGKWGKRLP